MSCFGGASLFGLRDGDALLVGDSPGYVSVLPCPSEGSSESKLCWQHVQGSWIMTVMIKVSKLKEKRESDVLTRIVTQKLLKRSPSRCMSFPRGGDFFWMFGRRLLWKRHCAD